jgi:2,4-dienoyl-CoA reductase-like NADH-dependent reductase (Old Yellow Enzyme family)
MVMAPMVTCLANSLGEVAQRMVDYYVKRAKGGLGDFENYFLRNSR